MLWNRRLSLVALACVSLALTVMMVKLPLDCISDYKTAHRELSTTKITAPIDHHIENLIQALPKQHLFGYSNLDLSQNVPITSMQLSLLGIMQTANTTASRVIISEAGQTGKVYRLHERLPSGLIVSAIVSDGVILDNAGHLEKLPLKRYELAFLGQPKSLLKES